MREARDFLSGKSHAVKRLLADEMEKASQALDFREYNFGTGTTTAKAVVRKHVDFLEIDRPLYPDHTRMKELVKSCEILTAVEKEIGSLE